MRLSCCCKPTIGPTSSWMSSVRLSRRPTSPSQRCEAFFKLRCKSLFFCYLQERPTRLSTPVHGLVSFQLRLTNCLMPRYCTLNSQESHPCQQDDFLGGSLNWGWSAESVEGKGICTEICLDDSKFSVDVTISRVWRWCWIGSTSYPIHHHHILWNMVGRFCAWSILCIYWQSRRCAQRALVPFKLRMLFWQKCSSS